MKSVFYTILCTLLFVFTSCNQQKTREDYLHVISKNDSYLSKPKAGDWRYEHPEKQQTFEAYKKSNPLKIKANANVFYLKPIGKFDKQQQKLLNLTREYVSIFFQQKVVILPQVNDDIIPKSSKRDFRGHQQFLASYILDSLLVNQIPRNGAVLMAITATDLYPRPSWNFVFGMASYHKKVAVTSTYRFQDGPLNSTNFRLALQRLIGVSTHEIGHMFSLRHCQFALCTMNGGNSQQEIDRTPNRLCSQCQRKLSWNLKYDHVKRLKELITFFATNHQKDDLRFAEKDLTTYLKSQ